jgi:hypothetical protein
MLAPAMPTPPNMALQMLEKACQILEDACQILEESHKMLADALL